MIDILSRHNEEQGGGSKVVRHAVSFCAPVFVSSGSRQICVDVNADDIGYRASHFSACRSRFKRYGYPTPP